MVVNAATYRKLVQEDLEWIKTVPRTLERDHLAITKSEQESIDMANDANNDFGPSHCYPTFRAGDTVHHFPTGEDWILAVDQFGDEVSPCGWPETIAKAADCTILERASDKQRHGQLLKSSKIPDPVDIRRRQARHQMNIQGG